MRRASADPYSGKPAEKLPTPGLPFVVGGFKCQFIGTHRNDAWFFGRAKRTLLHDDGTPFQHMTPVMAQAHRRVLNDAYRHATQSTERRRVR